VQRDVRARPGVGRRRQVVGVGFAGHLEDRQLLRRGHLRPRGEPLAIGPALQHGPGVGVALVGQFLDVVEEVEDQQRLLEACGGNRAGRAGEQVDQRLDVVTAEHGAEQFGRLFLRDQRAALLALGDPGQELGLDLGGIIDAGRHAVGDQLEQRPPRPAGGLLQQPDEFLGLLGSQRQRRNTKRSALGNMGTIGFQHGDVLSQREYSSKSNIVLQGHQRRQGQEPTLDPDGLTSVRLLVYNAPMDIPATLLYSIISAIAEAALAPSPEPPIPCRKRRLCRAHCPRRPSRGSCSHRRATVS
jgi:hypothetical protein